VPFSVTPERQRAPHHRPPLSPATQALPKRFAHALGPLRALYRSPASAGRTPRPLGQHPRLGRHHRQPRLSNGVSAAALRAHFRSLSYRVPSRTCKAPMRILNSCLIRLTGSPAPHLACGGDATWARDLLSLQPALASRLVVPSRVVLARKLQSRLVCWVTCGSPPVLSDVGARCELHSDGG
jgi:hypothetical protein